MKIVNAFPPNFLLIIEHFPEAKRRGAIFTYGDTVYAPRGVVVTPSLKYHETVHVNQQTAIGPDVWWRRYIDDVQFRFEQEVEAHRREYQWFASNSPYSKNQALHDISSRLSGKLYGKLVTQDEAKRRILA